MRLFTGLRALPHPPRATAVTIGVFDGVHRAHQRLVRSTAAFARGLRGLSVVVTFHPDPHLVLDPAHAPPALMPLDARIQALGELGVDWIWVIPFTKRFARTPAETFIRQVISARLNARVLVVGESFAFGHSRRGTQATLRWLGAELGLRVRAVPNVRRGGEPISSSRIRRLIAAGRLAEARRLLGRAPALYGTVVRGAGRGRTLGVPTANIALNASTIPPRGVYAVTVAVGARRYPGVMNLGVRPTFGAGPLVCEVHLLDLAPSRSLLTRRVAVLLSRRLRSERCFRSPQALVRQIRRDISRARRMFARNPLR